MRLQNITYFAQNKLKDVVVMENLLLFLILFPFGSAVLQSVSVNNTLRKIVTYVSSVAIMAAAIVFSVWWFANGAQPIALLSNTGIIDKVMMAGEIFLMVLVTVLSIKHKKYYAIVLSVVQTVALLWFELIGEKSIAHFEPAEANHLYIDQLTVIMILIIAVVGTLITVYACGYMVDYHHHHTEFKDRRRFFFSMMYTRLLLPLLHYEEVLMTVLGQPLHREATLKTATVHFL